jgi:hypothetical protein
MNGGEKWGGRGDGSWEMSYVTMSRGVRSESDVSLRHGRGLWWGVLREMEVSAPEFGWVEYG